MIKSIKRTKSAMNATAALLLAAFSGSTAYAAEPADLFSRANCFNNESITYNYFDPPQYRFVSSHHYDNGVKKHYVTENPTYKCEQYTGTDGNQTVDGKKCTYTVSSGTRHAGVHGAFLSSEPNPDGILLPYSNRWSVTGYHVDILPLGGWTRVITNASDCNLHLNQWY